MCHVIVVHSASTYALIRTFRPAFSSFFSEYFFAKRSHFPVVFVLYICPIKRRPSFFSFSPLSLSLSLSPSNCFVILLFYSYYANLAFFLRFFRSAFVLRNSVPQLSYCSPVLTLHAHPSPLPLVHHPHYSSPYLTSSAKLSLLYISSIQSFCVYLSLSTFLFYRILLYLFIIHLIYYCNILLFFCFTFRICLNNDLEKKSPF